MGRILAISVVSTVLLAQSTFKVDVQLVRHLATVKDASGKPVGGLTKEDFEVKDSGVRQTISVFERQTGQPLSVALLVDVSGSTAKELPYEVESVSRFLRSLFREGDPRDVASLYAFNWEVRQLSDYTRDTRLIGRRLKEMKAEAGTSMYDAIQLSSADLAGLEGRKVMIVVTDGGDTISRATFHQAAEAAQRADAIVYAVLVVPIENDAGRNTGGENALEILTASTGGRVFRPGNVDKVDAAFDEILKDLRTQYLIGYYPRSLPPASDKFRKVEISVRQQGLRVVTRSGYYE